MKRTTLLFVIASLLSPSAAVLGGPEKSVSPAIIPPAPTENGWWFRAAPYGWVTAISGDVGVGPLTAPIDISMSDTLKDLDMAAMGILEAGYGRWSFGVDLIYGKTSQDLQGGGRLFDSFRYEQKQWVITPTIAYRAIETGRYHMDVFAGARIMVLEADLTGRFARGGQVTRGVNTSWVDPIIGIRGQAELGDHWFFRYNGDIGGFGVSSDLTWQAFAGFGYRVSESVAVAVGYRGLGVDYSKGFFTLDSVTHGPVIGLEVRF
jgi:opacity protein-like surface antigen